MMGSTLETAAVGVIVAGALLWAVRAGWQSIKTRGGCSSCSSAGECPLVGNPDTPACRELIDLQEKGISKNSS